MFPSDWAEKKGSQAKKRKLSPKEEIKTLLEQCEALPRQHSRDGILGTIKRHINDTQFAPPIPSELRLDHVLSSVQYQEMLESLFGNSENSAKPNLPIVSKAYEESFMREPNHGERPCAMGPKCECMFIDPTRPFVAVEFELAFENNDPKMCVLCSRKTTQKLFYDACFSGKRVQGIIQRYGNLCCQPGEYAREVMLICPPNAPWNYLPLPIMSHQRNRYRVQIVAGKKYLDQLRVAYEDFVPPSARQD